MKAFTKQICEKSFIKLQMIHSGSAAITSIKFRAGITRRIAALVTFVLALSITGINAHAHTPHDMVIALGVSPDYADDQTLYVATDGPWSGWGFEEVIRSTNGGNTWVNIPNGLDHPYKYSVIRVSPDFGNDHTLFAATRGGGVYQSSNRGDSWQLSNTGLKKTNLNVAKLEIAGSKGAGYVLFLSDVGGALFRRSSTQTDWIQVQGKSSVAIIAVSPGFTQDTTVMTANATGSLRISTNGGVDWIDMGNPAGGIVHDIAIAPGGGTEIFLATSNGIFYSNDSGITFTHKPSNLPAEAINNVAVSPNYLNDRTVFCTSITKAVFKSTDSGNNWTLYKSGAAITKQTTALNEFSEIQVSNAFLTDQTVFLSAFDGLFISKDGGITWGEKQTRLSLITGLALSPNFMDDHRAIVTNYVGLPYSSADSGVTWVPGSWPNRPRLNMFDVHFAQNSTSSPMAVSATAGYLGFSADFGQNWTKKFIEKFPDISPGNVSTTVLALSPNFDIDQEIYLGTRMHGVIQTLNSGNSWRTLRGVPTSSQISSLVVSPNYANDRTAFAANRAGKVWRTTDGGESWSSIGATSILSRTGLGEKYIWIAISPDFATDQLVLVGTNNGIYRSGNGGNDWGPLLSNEIGPANVIHQIEFSPGFSSDRTIYVTVRGKGLYRVALGNDGLVASTPQNVGQWLLDRNIQFTEFRLSPSFAQDATILGAARDSVYITRDGGSTWALAGYLVP